MSNKKLGLMLLGLSFAVIAGFLILKLASNTNKQSTAKDVTVNQVAEFEQAEQEKETETQNSELQSSVKLTTEEVKKHNSKTDCWTIVSGKVYNITEYVSRHPGGSEILSACGIDSTTLFTERTTGTGQVVGSGSPHSNNAQSQLEELYLGDLQQ